MAEDNRYPHAVTLGDEQYELRLMTPDDDAAILTFADGLPSHDLLFVSRDITNAKVVRAWGEAIGNGSIVTLLARQGDKILGCAALIRDPLSWSPHLGEVRVLVAPAARNTGLGRALIQECFRLALDGELTKLTAQMTVDQKGAIAIFEELGFRGEGLLKDQVMDSDKTLHDIVILACDVARATGQLEAYGMAGAE